MSHENQCSFDHEYEPGQVVQSEMGAKWIISGVYWKVTDEMLVYHLKWPKERAETMESVERVDDLYTLVESE